MESKLTMLLLWCSAVVSVIVIATQSTTRTWLVVFWTVASMGFAIVYTVMYNLGRRRQKRWDAGDYD
jgi:membrane protein implicated in regulation of membrane protease activity